MAAITPERWKRIKDLFGSAVDLDPVSRQSYLESACRDDDSQIRQEVKRLLRHHEQGTSDDLSRLPLEIAGEPRETAFIAGDLVNGRFRVVRFIGKGGMGEVYEAEDEAIGVRVALKTIRSGMEMDDRLQTHFRREVQVARRITHPNVCRIYDLFEYWSDDPLLGAKQSLLFLTMELLDGESLAERIAKSGPIAQSEALPLIRDIVLALDAAHRAGVIHRDLKTSNVMLVRRDGQDRAVLTDFGVASLGVCVDEHVAGTPAYMAPEQLRGGIVNTRTDIFALGVVLYEMLAGTKPFAKDRSGEPPRIAGASPQLEAAIRRCLEADPSRRYGDAAGLLADIDKSRISVLTRRSAIATAAASIAAWIFTTRRPSASSLRIESVAVLPFENLSGDAEAGDLAIGLADELSMMLSRVRGLRVIARNSTSRLEPKQDLKTIGRKLNVRAVILGGIRKSGDRISVNAQLAGVDGGAWLWSGSFDEERRNLPQLRVNLGLAIVGAVAPHFTSAQLSATNGPQPRNSEAYQLYLSGKLYASYRTDNGLRRSPDYLLQSVALDSEFAPAFAALADCYNILAGREGCPPEEYFPKAEAAANRALALDAQLGDAHVSLGSVFERFRWDWPQSERHFKLALDFNPGLAVAHHWYAGLLSNLTRHAEALREIEIASQLDPLSPSIGTAYAVYLYRARRYEDSIARFQRTLAAFPSYAVALPQLAEVYIRMGRWDEAQAALRKAAELGEDSATILARTGETLALSGHREEALAAVKQLEADFAHKHYSTARIATVYRALGDRDRAFYWFEESLRRKEAALTILKTDPANDEIKQDPRFSKLLEALRL